MTTTVDQKRKKLEQNLEQNRRYLAKQLLEKARQNRIETYQQTQLEMKKAIKAKQFSYARELFKKSQQQLKIQQQSVKKKAIDILQKDSRVINNASALLDKQDLTKMTTRSEKDPNFEIWQKNRNLQNQKTDEKGIKTPKSMSRDLDAQRAYILDRLTHSFDNERMQLLQPRKKMFSK